jgi:hypothetical protein
MKTPKMIRSALSIALALLLPDALRAQALTNVAELRMQAATSQSTGPNSVFSPTFARVPRR